MIGPVMIKGNKTGIRIILSENALLDDVLASLDKKLDSTKEYCTNNKPITVIFEGKALTEDEKSEILKTLREKGINTVCPTENATDKQESIHNIKEHIKQIQYDKTGLFYIGNLRNGQSITAMASIVIVGDVEAGASVESTGNIVVIGKAEGIIKSGCTGNPNTFFYSYNK